MTFDNCMDLFIVKNKNCFIKVFLYGCVCVFLFSKYGDMYSDKFF